VTKNRIFDIHGHIGYWPFPIPPSSPDEVVGLIRRAGIERLIVSSTLGLLYDFREGNRAANEAVKNHPELLAYVVVNANYLEESCQEMDRYLNRDKFVGVKVHTVLQGRTSDSPENLRLLEEVAKRGRPVLLHGSELSETLRAVKRFPELPIILAHGGIPPEKAAEAAANFDNLFLDFAGSCQPHRRIKRAVEIAGAEKILFGSDVNIVSVEFVLGAYQEAGLDEQQAEKVFWTNAIRLFNIEE
jgi:hypothetical protein